MLLKRAASLFKVESLSSMMQMNRDLQNAKLAAILSVLGRLMENRFLG